jgi:cell division septation protein DedD
MKKLIATIVVMLAATGLASTAGASTRGNCGARPDHHNKWAVVFATEKTRDAARKTLARVLAKGFKAGIEVESCTEFEIEYGRFANRAAAQALANRARAAGFTRAKVEDS